MIFVVNDFSSMRSQFSSQSFLPWCIAEVTLLEISLAFFLCVRQDPHHIDDLLMTFNQGERLNGTGEVKFTNH